MAGAATWFVLNLYLGDVNPDTADGLKLYKKVVAAQDSKIATHQSHAREIKTTFEFDTNSFGWGPATGAIQIDNAGTTKNILTQACEITLEMMQRAARRTWLALAPVFVWADPLPAVFSVGVIDPATNSVQRPQFFVVHGPSWLLKESKLPSIATL